MEEIQVISFFLGYFITFPLTYLWYRHCKRVAEINEWYDEWVEEDPVRAISKMLDMDEEKVREIHEWFKRGNNKADDSSKEVRDDDEEIQKSAMEHLFERLGGRE